MYNTSISGLLLMGVLNCAGRVSVEEEVQLDRVAVAQPQCHLVRGRSGGRALGPCCAEDVRPHLRLHPREGAPGHALLL